MAPRRRSSAALCLLLCAALCAGADALVWDFATNPQLHQGCAIAGPGCGCTKLVAAQINRGAASPTSPVIVIDRTDTALKGTVIVESENSDDIRDGVQPLIVATSWGGFVSRDAASATRVDAAPGGATWAFDIDIPLPPGGLPDERAYLVVAWDAFADKAAANGTGAAGWKPPGLGCSLPTWDSRLWSEQVMWEAARDGRVGDGRGGYPGAECGGSAARTRIGLCCDGGGGALGSRLECDCQADEGRSATALMLTYAGVPPGAADPRVECERRLSDLGGTLVPAGPFGGGAGTPGGAPPAAPATPPGVPAPPPAPGVVPIPPSPPGEDKCDDGDDSNDDGCGGGLAWWWILLAALLPLLLLLLLCCYCCCGGRGKAEFDLQDGDLDLGCTRLHVGDPKAALKAAEAAQMEEGQPDSPWSIARGPLDEGDPPTPEAEASGDGAAPPRRRLLTPPPVLWTDMRVRPSDIEWRRDEKTGERVLLDAGDYGEVYAARLPRAAPHARDSVVALVLPLPAGSRGGRGRERVLAELETLRRRVRERYVVNFLGVCHEPARVVVLCQLVPRGEFSPASSGAGYPPPTPAEIQAWIAKTERYLKELHTALEAAGSAAAGGAPAPGAGASRLRGRADSSSAESVTPAGERG